jgi:hypothetical protein
MRAEISLSGTVLANEWSNPHVYSSLETAEGGDTATWEIEGGAVAMMRCHGWTATSLSTGDAVLVAGNPGRDPRQASPASGSPMARARRGVCSRMLERCL